MLTSKQRAELRAKANGLEVTLMIGKEGISGGTAETASGKGVWTGIVWIIGLAVVGAAVFALASTGGVQPAMRKLRDNANEMTGGFFDRKNKK